MGMRTTIFPVKDIGQAKQLYAQWLGTQPYVDQPYYVGFRVGQDEVGLDPNGHTQGLTGPVSYLLVDDIRGRVQSLAGSGAQIVQDVRDVGGGRLVASLKDADGNMLGLMQDGG
jgi:predicted enzyme related to lactoylglutathione lyase